MKGITASVLVLLGLFFSAMAQEEKATFGWQKEMTTGINLTQTSFDNWTQGGENTFSWQWTYAFKFVHTGPKTIWANSGKFDFGMTRVGEEEAKKSIDEIRLESVLSYKIGALNPFASVTGKSQFGPGWDYGAEPKVQVSNFMDPAYFRESVGFGYQPNDNFFTRAGLALKQTVTSDFPIPYADDPETTEIEKLRAEVGAESVTDIKVKVSETAEVTSKLELFSNLKGLDEIDVNWDTILVAKVSKWVNLNFNVKLFYDKDISKKRQLKQALAIGFAYNFF